MLLRGLCMCLTLINRLLKSNLQRSFRQIVDCRICGDPNSAMRFAFVESTNEEGARVALHLSGKVHRFYPVRVLPSKTAIAPTFLPRVRCSLPAVSVFFC
ncbi:hypothetical protein QQ045_010427 [Rhodiola kirilowii]